MIGNIMKVASWLCVRVAGHSWEIQVGISDMDTEETIIKMLINDIVEKRGDRRWKLTPAGHTLCEMWKANGEEGPWEPLPGVYGPTDEALDSVWTDRLLSRPPPPPEGPLESGTWPDSQPADLPAVSRFVGREKPGVETFSAWLREKRQASGSKI